jgi:hypothetical protein
MREHRLQQFVYYSVILCLSIAEKRDQRLATQQLRSLHCWQRNLGNEFTEPLSSNGHIRHNIFIYLWSI